VTISTRFGIVLAFLAAGCGTAFLGDVTQSHEGTKPPAAKRDKDKDKDKDEGAKKEDAKGEGADEKKEEKKDEKEKPEEVPAKVDVRCVTARRLPFTITVDGLGRTEPLPECVGSLTAAVEGHVHELLVKLGDTVKAGQPILQLDPTVAKAALAEKQANRDSLIAALKLLVSVPRPEESRPHELAVETAKISLEHDKQQVEILRPLVSQNDISKKQFHDAEVLYEQAKVALQTAEAQLKLFMTGPRPEAVEEGQTKIKMAEQAVASSKETLDLHTLRAPIAGVVESLNCHPGQTLTIGTAVGEVIDIRRLFVTVYFPARVTRLLQPGMIAKVDLSDGAHPASESSAKDKDEKKESEPAASDKGKEKDGGKDTDNKDVDKEKGEKEKEDKDVVSGKVAFIGNSADPQTGNYAVRILMDNEGGRLRLGQVVKATILLRTEEPQIAVPETAIFDQGEGPLLAVVREGKIRLLHPELGATQDGNVAVTKTDLKEGEKVIVEGAYGVEDDKVEVGNILPEKPAEKEKAEGDSKEKEKAGESKEKEKEPAESKEKSAAESKEKGAAESKEKGPADSKEKAPAEAKEKAKGGERE
jgi:RND family efflux transporter MFP subunit